MADAQWAGLLGLDTHRQFLRGSKSPPKYGSSLLDNIGIDPRNAASKGLWDHAYAPGRHRLKS